MLKGLDPLLSPDLLAILASMGHGDEIAIVDANFPATAIARRLVRLDGANVTQALSAVLSLMPLDDFVDACAFYMQVVDRPDAKLPIISEFGRLLDAANGAPTSIAGLERHAFYERARQSFAVITTSETRLYGNIILKKGVVRAAESGPRHSNGIIDAHQHYWSLARGDYGWLTPALAPIHRDFGPVDLTPFLRRYDIAQTVLVQAAPTVAETEYLLQIADAHPGIAAVTGWVDFRDGAASLRRHAHHPKFRAVRPMLQDITCTRWILDERCAPTLEAVEDHGLIFEFLGTPRHLHVALELAASRPRLSIVLDHAMKPDIAGDGFAAWAPAMAELASLPNTVCKLSGLVTEAGPDWTVARLEPYVRHIIEHFGARRVMWGSDWPVVDLAGGYDAWRAATHALLDARSEAPDILGGTARRFYRIQPLSS